jgi:hypothetical protein
MKIERLYEKKKKLHKDEYYLVQEIAGDDIYNIPPDANEYEFNYDAHDLEDVVRFYIEEDENYSSPLRVIKIIEEEIDNETINRINDAKKYNL